MIWWIPSFVIFTRTVTVTAIATQGKMIEVVISPQCQEIMDFLEIDRNMVVKTINERHRGHLDPAMNRIIAVHWFSDTQIVFADTEVTNREIDDDNKTVRFREVKAHVVLDLRPDLPAGSINREMGMVEIFEVIARSFGEPVTCHPKHEPSTLYSGPWDGQTIAIKPHGKATIGFFGSFSVEKKSCTLGWALNLERYREWFLKGRVVKYTPLFKEMASERYGVRSALVDRLIRHPDREQAVNFESGLILKFFAGRVPFTRPKQYLLTYGRVNGNELEITRAFKVYSDFHPDVESLTPIQLLIEIAERFGLEVTVGRLKGKLLFNQKVPISEAVSGTQLVSIQNPKDHSFLQEMAVMITQEGDQRIANCSLVYCIDTDTYTRYLKGR